MRKLMFTLAALIFLGPACVPPDAQPIVAEKAPLDYTPPVTAAVQLRTSDGTPVPDNKVRKTHVVGRSPCPDPIDPLIVDLGTDLKQSCRLTPKDLPKWMGVSRKQPAAALAGRGIVLGLEFNCDIDDRSTHVVQVNAGFALDCAGDPIGTDEGGGWSNGDKIDIKTELDVVTREDAVKREKR